MERYKQYKAVITCTYWYSEKDYCGVLFANRVDSKEQANDLMFDEILRLIEDFGGSERMDGSGKVTVESFRDNLDEWVTRIQCPDGTIYDYKLMFEEDEEVKKHEA